MPIHAITNDYQGAVRDAKANFAGNILVFFGWDEHLFFPSPKAAPLNPDMKWSDVVAGVMPELFGQHQEFSQIKWENVQWMLDNQSIIPDPNKTLAELGADHKSCFRFVTPELKGYRGLGI